MTTLTTLHEFTTPLHEDSPEGRTAIETAKALAQADGRKIYAFELTDEQMTLQTTLTKAGYKTRVGVALAKLSLVKDGEGFGEVVALRYTKAGRKPRDGWAVVMEMATKEALTAEQKEALTRIMKEELTPRFK